MASRKSKKDTVVEAEIKDSPGKGSSGDGSSAGGDEKPKSNAKKYLRIAKWLGFGCFILILLSVGIAVGGYTVPRVKNWLEDHNFIGTEEEASSDGSDSSTSVKREVISEENMISDVVDEVKESVVSIAVSEANLDPQKGVLEDSVNIGTGFVIDDDGLILTNQHVVSNQSEDYIVISFDGKEYEVEEIARDDVNDLAILKVKGNGLKPLTLGNSDDVKVGQYVVAIGTPLGDFPGSVTTGIISGIGRSVSAGDSFGATVKTYEGVIQTDAAINPGNSGGPLLDLDGNVIGINFATTSGADNISFAIPINLTKGRIAEYKKYGKFIKPYLGVEYEIITQTQAMFYTNVVPGALVRNVLDESPADKAGLQKADIITKVEDELVGSSLSALIQKHKVGEEITLEVWRDGKTREVTVKLEEAD